MPRRPPSAPTASPWPGRLAGDLLLRLTTTPVPAGWAERTGLTGTLDRLGKAGWTIRAAGPRWFVIWTEDDARLRRLQYLILPAPHIGLTGDEAEAVLADQLRQLGALPAGDEMIPPEGIEIWAKIARAQKWG